MTRDFLLEKGFKEYPEKNINYPYTQRCLYQKRVESESVCETNDRLSINVREYRILEASQSTYEVDIVAEKDGLWWELKAYSLNEAELVAKLDSIEDRLIKMFNSIK